jgi:hypothetical protein
MPSCCMIRCGIFESLLNPAVEADLPYKNAEAASDDNHVWERNLRQKHRSRSHRAARSRFA